MAQVGTQGFGRLFLTRVAVQEDAVVLFGVQPQCFPYIKDKVEAVDRALYGIRIGKRQPAFLKQAGKHLFLFEIDIKVFICRKSPFASHHLFEQHAVFPVYADIGKVLVKPCADGFGQGEQFDGFHMW